MCRGIAKKYKFKINVIIFRGRKLLFLSDHASRQRAVDKTYKLRTIDVYAFEGFNSISSCTHRLRRTRFSGGVGGGGGEKYGEKCEMFHFSINLRILAPRAFPFFFEK